MSPVVVVIVDGRSGFGLSGWVAGVPTPALTPSPPSPPSLFLFPSRRAKRFINLAGETSLLSSHGSGSAFGYDLRLGRHSLGFHTGSDPAFPDQDLPGWDVIAKLEGVGITSPAHLFDGGVEHPSSVPVCARCSPMLRAANIDAFPRA